MTVRLFATFRDFLPSHAAGAALRVQVDEPAAVRVLLQIIGLPEDMPRIVLINGHYAAEESLLSEGDAVSVFPPLIGGSSSTED